jgi:hypothetical protein
MNWISANERHPEIIEEYGESDVAYCKLKGINQQWH